MQDVQKWRSNSIAKKYNLCGNFIVISIYSHSPTHYIIAIRAACVICKINYYMLYMHCVVHQLTPYSVRFAIVLVYKANDKRAYNPLSHSIIKCFIGNLHFHFVILAICIRFSNGPNLRAETIAGDIICHYSALH